MKRIFALLLVLVLCLSLTACGNGEQLAAYEATIETMQADLVELENTNAEYAARVAELEGELDTMRESWNQYSGIIDGIENGSYDSAIYEIECLKEEARLAEFADKGIVEVEITLENWTEYFEYAPYAAVYIKNSFGEPEVIEFMGGIKLKDEYTLVENGGSDVNFELESAKETRPCTVDFTTSEITIGDVSSVTDTIHDTYTTSFSDSTVLYAEQTGSVTPNVDPFGQIRQINRDSGEVVTEDIIFCTIANMLRVEGKLIMYQD